MDLRYAARRAPWFLVEQNKIKRAGTGLRAIDHERAFPGFTRFCLYRTRHALLKRQTLKRPSGRCGMQAGNAIESSRRPAA